MSYLAPPRLNFFGTVIANASTATNNDLADVFDVDLVKLKSQMTLIPGAEPRVPPEDGFHYGGNKDNPELRNWLMGLIKIPEDLHEKGFGQPAHWNYYGDHSTVFKNVFVNGGSDPAYQPLGPGDPVLNHVQVELLGDIFYGTRLGAVLVDVDPYALVTSQIFAGQLLLSVTRDGKKIPLVEGNRPTRAFSYFINPHKNLNPACEGFEGVSAIFQFGVPSASLVFHEAPNFASPALAALRKAAAAGQGLQVRYCFYDAAFQVQAEDLHKSFQDQDYISNPYIGKVLGTIGVWQKNELASAPPGRKLRLQTMYSYTPPEPQLEPAAHAEKRAAMASIQTYQGPRKAERIADPMQQKATLGVCLANVDSRSRIVSLDAISTFPEATLRDRRKFDLGSLRLVLLYGNAESVVIGDVAYTDRHNYERAGGMIDISYANHPRRRIIDENIATGRLAIYQVDSKLHLLAETPELDVQTDDRAIYFDARRKSDGRVVAGAGQIKIQVFNKGRAPEWQKKLHLEYWTCSKTLVNPDKPQVNVTDRYFTIEGAMQLGTTPYTLDYLDGHTIDVITDEITVPAGGEFTLKLIAVRPGVSVIRFVDPTESPPPTPNFGWDNVDFAIVRILPFDDYSGYTDEQINPWPFIYEHVFGFFSVMYPIMSKVIPWGPYDAPDDPEQVRAFASNILSFTDPAKWDSTLYMPITRDLSEGKRILLRRWCNLQQ